MNFRSIIPGWGATSVGEMDFNGSRWAQVVYEWGNVFKLWAGGLLSWLVHPLLWLDFGPFRWMAFLAMTAGAESQYHRLAEGAANEKGLLQFTDATWATLTDGKERDPFSAFWQGWYAAPLWMSIQLTSWRWTVGARPPIYGLGVFRYAWRHAPTQEAAKTALKSGWLAELRTDGAWQSALFWTALFFPFQLLEFALLWWTFYPRRKKGRR